MTSSNGNIFYVTGPLWEESTSHLWIPLTKASDSELWFFFMHAWTNSSANNQDGHDLGCHCVHYDVTVICDIWGVFVSSTWSLLFVLSVLLCFMQYHVIWGHVIMVLHCIKLISPWTKHFTDNIFKCIFINEKCISIRISLKYIPKGSINNKWSLVQVMAWHRTGDKPLPEPVLTHFTDAYMHHQGEMNESFVKCALGLVGI